MLEKGLLGGELLTYKTTFSKCSLEKTVVIFKELKVKFLLSQDPCLFASKRTCSQV